MSRRNRRYTYRSVNGQANEAVAIATSTTTNHGFVGSYWSWIAAAFMLAAFVWSYWPTLADMVQQWINQPDYSHGFLVLPLSIFFLWSKRGQLSRDALRPAATGLLLLLVASGFRVFAGAFYLTPLDGWTIPIWVAGAVVLLFGWRCLAWSWAAIVFLWFMIPMPYRAESMLSVPLQSVATKFSTASLVMLGQPALAEGNTIWLGEHQLFIEEACSGLRIFMGILALAFAFALFSRWSWWQKALVLTAAFPIAIVANVTRVVITALLYQFSSGETARHFMHDISGLVAIPFAAGLFWLFLIYLDRLFPEVATLSAFEVSQTAKNSL